MYLALEGSKLSHLKGAILSFRVLGDTQKFGLTHKLGVVPDQCMKSLSINDVYITGLCKLSIVEAVK